MSASSIERVQVILEAITTKFQNAMDRANSKLQAVNSNMQGFGKVMKMPLADFKTMNKNMATVTNTGSKFASKIRLATHGLRGFRMEMLGVMFFGMMLQQTFMGLLQPVMDAYGVFDLWNVMLLTVFLPIMDAIFPIILQVMEWFMNLPEPVQKVIGVLVILGAILGTFLFLFGSMSLGLGSLIQVIPTLIGLFSGFMGIIGLAGAPLLLIIGIIAAIIIIIFGLWLAWKENWGNIRDWLGLAWEGMKAIFQGAFDVIMGIVDIFTGLFEGDLDKVLAGVKRVFGGIWSIITGIVKLIVGLVASIALAIARLAWGIIQCLLDAVGRLWDWINNLLGGVPQKMLDFGIMIVKGLINGITSMAGAVWNAFLGLFPDWLRNLIQGIVGGTFKIVSGAWDVITGGNKKGDFIMRPGQGATEFSSDDTIVGYKGNAPFGGGGNAVTNITNNFYGFTKDELKRELDDRDRKMADEIRRLVKA